MLSLINEYECSRTLGCRRNGFALNKRNLRLAANGFILTRNRGFLPGFCLCSHFSHSP